METNNIDINNLHPFTLSSSFVRGETSAATTFNSHQNPRKKRTKFTRTDTIHGCAGHISKPKTARRPDPTAPKITRPCTECGKKFWSWKALFGHMRCHPERQWRGINPPPNLRRQETDSGTAEDDSSSVTEEDHEVATCLLMLANGVPVPVPVPFPIPPTASDQSPSVTTACTVNQGTPEYSDSGRDIDQIMNTVDHGVGTTYSAGNLNCGRFECSSCKKVFGSHQALGGHRASHKNVKGCYAITKNDGEEEGCCLGLDLMIKDNNINGHKCSICLRVFSSGQALGGHMRCHWEKVAEDQPSRVSAFDLNLAVQDHDDDASSSPALDLRLGL